MRASGLILVSTVLVLFGLRVAAATTADQAGLVQGVVADESGGVLPGVTVVVRAGDGGLLATGVTDGVGRYAFRGLPGPGVKLTFQLEGFASVVVDVAITPHVDCTVATQRLTLAPKSETVIVRGALRVDAPPPPPRVVSPPPPRPVARPVPAHDRDSVCGPAKPGRATESLGTIRSRRTTAGNALYSAGDELIIDGGTSSGLDVGQNVVARRAYRTSADPNGVAGEHTAGLLQIVAADAGAAVATVVYACDELLPGDWLAPFAPEPLRAPEPPGRPAYDRAARILLTDAGQLIGAPRRLMVIDRGSDNAFRVGQRLTLFRPSPGGRGPSVIGDAVIVAVRLDSATIRVQRATDVIAVGDQAAPQRP
jgi:hypothetical protein